MSLPDTVMMMAAGFGTRMGALTKACPKPLLPLGSGRLIDHGLDLAARGGVARAVVNLHYLGDQIRAYLSDRDKPAIRFSDETACLLDTGGALVQALPFLGDDPFLVINSDAVFVGPNPFDTLNRHWPRPDIDALLLLVSRDRVHGYTRPGDFYLGADGRAPSRRADAATAPYVYTGLQILSPTALVDPPARVFSTNVIWDRVMAKGRLAAVIYPGEWVDVGTPDGLSIAETLMEGQSA